MNWETAKTWLIGLFLILDVVLGWQMYSSRQLMNGYVESQADLLANTKTLLAEHGMTLAVSVPTKQPELPSFQAKEETPDLNALAKAVFPNASIERVSANLGQVTTNSGQITVLGNGVWEVAFSPPDVLTQTQNALSVTYQGQSYLSDAAASTDRHQVYVQSYKNYPIFDTSITTTQTKNVLQGYSQSMLSQIQPTGAPKPVISALDALDSLANAVDKSNVNGDNKILKVDLGFARKVPLYESDASANYWFPVWRVVTQGQGESQTYFVNAFTGEVEIVP